MIRSCWCGNTILIPYNDDYLCCSQCHTLILNKGLQEREHAGGIDKHEVYDQPYLFSYIFSLYRNMGCSSVDDILLLHYRERAVAWGFSLTKYLLLSARIVEVSCGMGTFVKLCQSIGYDVSGYEINKGWVDFLSKKLDSLIYAKDFSSASETGKFDALVMLDLVEHLENPLDTLQNFCSKVTDNGIIMLQMPCYDNQTFATHTQTKSPFLRQLKPDQHMYLYSRESAQRLMSLLGVSKIYRETNIFPADMFFVASRHPLQSKNNEEVVKKNRENPESLIPYSTISTYGVMHAVLGPRNIKVSDIHWIGYGDSRGRVFRYENNVYRAITEEYSSVIEKFMVSFIFDELQQRHYIPNTIISKNISLEGYGLILEHEKLQRSTPAEWTFSILKEASLFLLELNSLLKKNGVAFLDGHPYTVVFDKNMLVVTDITSIGPLELAGDFEQEFLETCIYPLILYAQGETYVVRALLNASSSLIDRVKPASNIWQSNAIRQILSNFAQQDISEARDKFLDPQFIREKVYYEYSTNTMRESHHDDFFSAWENGQLPDRFQRYRKISDYVARLCPDALDAIDLAGREGLFAVIWNPGFPGDSLDCSTATTMKK